MLSHPLLLVASRPSLSDFPLHQNHPDYAFFGDISLHFFLILLCVHFNVLTKAYIFMRECSLYDIAQKA